METALLKDIKAGVEGMITTQKLHESRLAELEQWSRARKTGIGVSVPGVDEGRDKFQFRKAIYGIATGDWSKCGYEKDVFVASQKALDSSTGGSGGGYVVPNEILAQQFIELLRAKSVVRRMGARVLDGLIGSPVSIPKQTGSGTVYWIGQNATVTASDPNFSQVQLTPKTMAMRSQYSNLLGLLANPSMETLIRDDMAKTAALEMDRVVLRGSGASNQPTGIANASSIGSLAIGANGGLFDWDVAASALGTLDSANALEGNVGIVFHPKVKWKLKKVRMPQYSGDPGGLYVVPPIIGEKQLADMLGYPFGSTTQIPTNLVKGSGTNLSEVYVVNWDDVLVGMWGGLELLATNIGGNAWTQNAVELRMIANMDVQLRHPESVCLINDAQSV